MTELDLHQLTGAYALDALPPEEETLFLAHLDECDSCQAEAAGFRRTVDRLADLVAEAPPPDLRRRVLEEADRTRQLPPVVTQIDARRRRRRLTTIIAAGLAAAAVIIGVAVANNGPPSQGEIVASVVEASDSHTVNTTVTGGGRATVIFSPSQAAWVVKLSDLPSLPATQTYELWVFDQAGTPKPAGLFEPPSHGAVTKLITDAATSQAVAITVEPAAGSKAPTTTPILNVPRA